MDLILIPAGLSCRGGPVCSYYAYIKYVLNKTYGTFKCVSNSTKKDYLIKKSLSKIQGSSILCVFCAVLFFTPVSMSFLKLLRVLNIIAIELYFKPEPLITKKSLITAKHSKLLKNEYFAMNGKKVNLQSMGINSNVASVIISAQYLSNGNVVYKKNPLMRH
jgi:hypothetical protein